MDIQRKVMERGQQIKVLLLEDKKSDVELIQLQLEDFQYQCVFEVAGNREAYVRLLHEFKPDLVLADFSLPNFDGLQALEILRKQDGLTPFIFVTGSLGEEKAVEAIRAGATDFIIKSRVEYLAAAVTRALREKSERKGKEYYAKQLEANASFVSALLRYEHWENALNEAFEVVGEAVAADRVYYFENGVDEATGERFTSQRIEWARDSTEPQIDNPGLQKLPFKYFKEFMALLSEKRHFQAVVSRLPNDRLKETLSSQQILSFLVLPIFINDCFYGFMGFDDCTRERVWSPDEISFLETLSFNLAFAIERRISATAVKRSEQRFKTVISNIPGITYRGMADKDWTMQFISDEVERMTGYPAEDFIFNKKRTFASIVHPDDLEQTYFIVNHQLKKKEAFSLEYRLVCADGSLRWAEERGIGIYGPEGNLLCIDGVIMDVTERKRANEKFRAIFEQTSDAILLSNNEGRYIDFNEAAIKTFGYSAEELGKMKAGQLMGIPIEDFSELWNRFVKADEQKGRIELLRKNGSKMIVRYTAKPNILPGVHLSIVSDVTEKVKQEEQLLASERRFKAMVQDGSDLMGILDAEGNYLFVSDNFTTILGIHPKEFIGNNVFEFIHAQDKERVAEKFFSLTETKHVYFEPFRFRGSDDRWRMIETTATNLLDDPSVGGIVFNARDVTEAILKNEELKFSNERFEIAMKATNEMIWDWNLATGQVIRSKGFGSIFGFHESASTCLPNFWLERIHREDTEAVLQSIKTALENKNQEKWDLEYRIVKANGEVAIIYDRGFIIRDSTGQAIRVVGSVSDVTESHKMANEISLQNKALREIAWTQSHAVRAPLARLKGLISLLEIEEFDLLSQKEILKMITASADELDDIIRQVVKEVEKIEK